jgi:hypothetical protein
MKKSILLAAAGVAAVMLLPNAAQAGIAKNLNAKGQAIVFDMTPNTAFTFELPLLDSVKVKANACGLLKVDTEPSSDSYFFKPPIAVGPYVGFAPQLQYQDILALPVATVPTCTGATPSATVPVTFKTSTGEVWKSGLTPGGTYYTANGKPNKAVKIKAKSNACGIAKPRIDAVLLKKFGLNSFQALDGGPMLVRQNPDSPTSPTTFSEQFEGSEFVDGVDAAPICVKTSLYVAAPN